MIGELSKNFNGVGIGPLSKILAVKREIEKKMKNAQDKKACSFIRKYLRVIMTRLFLKKFSFETPFSWFSYLLSTGQINNIYDNKTTYQGLYTVGVLNAIPFRFPKYNTKFGLHHPCTTRDDRDRKTS